MTISKNIPDYVFPIEALTNGTAQLVGSVRMKVDSDGRQKSSVVFDGAAGWVLPVEVLIGFGDKVLPSGEKVKTADVRRVNVNVFSPLEPVVEVGDYLAFENVLVGAFDSTLFFHCGGVKKVDSETSSLDFEVS